jgi:hypothetical protein
MGENFYDLVDVASLMMMNFEVKPKNTGESFRKMESKSGLPCHSVRPNNKIQSRKETCWCAMKYLSRNRKGRSAMR